MARSLIPKTYTLRFHIEVEVGHLPTILDFPQDQFLSLSEKQQGYHHRIN